MKDRNDFWEQRYSEKDYVYGEEPNEFFQAQLKNFPVGKLLLPAEGEGRNAVYAATEGWKVTAFDKAVAGKQKAQHLAQKRGVEIDYKISAATEYDSPQNFDMIALVYAHFGSADRAAVHQRLLKLLKPGGAVIFEAFSKEQLNYSSGGPKDEEMLFSEKEIREEFEGLTFDFIAKEKISLAEGKYHQGEGSVIRFIGTKAS